MGHRHGLVTAIVSLACVFLSGPAAAQPQAPALSAPAVQPAPNPQEEKSKEPPAKPAQPVATQVALAGSSTSGQSIPRVELGDSINVTVDHLSEWAKGQPPAGEAVSASGRDPLKLQLYLDGYLLKGVSVVAVQGDTVTFRLRRTSDNRESWAALLSRPKSQRTVVVNVGMPGQPAFTPAASPPQIQLAPYDPLVFWFSAIGFLALALAFARLALRSGLLRDTDTQSDPSKRPYSLGRCQMALWFFTILGSFIFLRVVTKDWDVIPNQALVLMGISVGTGLSAAVIDKSKRESARSELSELQAKAVRTLAEDNRISELKKQIAGPEHDTLLTDILSDADGVSFHRFQIFAWTIVLWVLFVGSVVYLLAMPEFSDQLLGLLGISGGTYLGFKFPEKKV